MNQKEINVHIGEVRIAKDGEILKTILGSCVAIGIIWRQRKICGLAHCLLAESPVKTFSIGGRFVDQAIPSLMALMKIRPEHISEIEVFVTGGGNMTQPGAKNTDALVGAHNFHVAERELKKLGIRPIELNKAAEDGRRVKLDSLSCQYVIEAIPRILIHSEAG
jgi:chemotaxis protein CheD